MQDVVMTTGSRVCQHKTDGKPSRVRLNLYKSLGSGLTFHSVLRSKPSSDEGESLDPLERKTQ